MGELCPESLFLLCPVCVRWGAVPRIPFPCMFGVCAEGSRPAAPKGQIQVECIKSIPKSKLNVSGNSEAIEHYVAPENGETNHIVQQNTMS